MDMLESRVRGWADVNARDRVRLAIKARLETLGMTQRAFGRAFSANDGHGHVDTWVSSLLAGQFALSLDELDEAATILRTTAATLVQSSYDHAAYLSPTEHRIIQAVRTLPAPIRDHFLMLAEYLIGVAPDEIEHVQEFRKLTTEEKQKVQHWTHALLRAQEPVPVLAILPDRTETAAKPPAATPRTRGPRQK